jgi:hypothetical protein
MSSLLNEFEELQKRLRALEANPLLQHEIKFKNSLLDLLKSFDISPTKAIEILKQASPAGAKKDARYSAKIYKNPHTGETAEVSTMLAKPVSEWAKQHGKAEVKKWVIAA